MRARVLLIVVTAAVLALGPACSSDDEKEPSAAKAPCEELGGLGRVRGGGAGKRAPDTGGDDEVIDVLLFTRTTGFRHSSIELAKDWFATLEPEGVRATATEDPTDFSAENLARYDVVAFVSTTGDVLDAEQQRALEDWVEGGGGWVGVHAAADTEYDWDWYGNDLVGAWFTSHPPLLQNVQVTTEATNDPTVAHFDKTWAFTEEWYNFDRNPRYTSDILLTIDEKSATLATGGPVGDAFTNGADHPVAWSHQVGEGRSWYTNLGHLDLTWTNEDYLTHVLEGVRWAAAPERYRRSVITRDMEAPVALEVADSGLVLWAVRGGEVEAWDPRTGKIHRLGTVPTHVEGEGGMMGLRLGPDAAETGALYTYATSADTDDGFENMVRRFTLGPDCTFDPAESDTLLEFPTDLASHQGSDLQFMADGTLLIGVGDDAKNVPDGQAPLDDTEDPPLADARRTSGNPEDLRGKILRINPDGSIPEGNLYPRDGSEGRPEIYVTGVRNPYRIAEEPGTGVVWWGEVGPDAVAPGERGPQGFDEVNRAAKPGDHGWPFCIGDNLPYNEYDAATGEVGPPYDCSDKVPAVIAYDYTNLTEPVLGTGFRNNPDGSVTPLGRSMMAGPWYSPGKGASAALPLGEVLLLHEFSRNLLIAATVEGDEVASLRAVMPWAGINTPIDVETGPDGAIYVLEHGAWSALTKGEPALTRLEYSPTGRFPRLPKTRRADRVEKDEPMTGGEVFAEKCSSCHGVTANGGIGPSLIDVDERLDRAEITEVVTNGRNQMPPWGRTLSKEEIDAVVEYVSSLGD